MVLKTARFENSSKRDYLTLQRVVRSASTRLE